MDIHEEAAFWQSCGERGILIFPSPKGSDPDYPITIQKIPTTCDERAFLDDENEECEARSMKEAIVFVKDYINWKWETDTRDAPEPQQLIHLDGYVVYDEGFGPQQRHLGHVVQSADDPDWHDKALEECKTLAQAYFKENIPDRKWSDLKPDLKIQPCQTQ